MMDEHREVREIQPGDICCAMRRHFYLGIVGCRSDQVAPAETAEFVDWQASADPGAKGTVIRIRYCPWCGADVREQELRAVL